MNKKHANWLILPFAGAFGIITYWAILNGEHAPTIYFLQVGLCMAVILVLGLEVGFLFAFLATMAGMGAISSAASKTSSLFIATEILAVWIFISLASYFERRHLREKTQHEFSMEKSEKALNELRRELAAYGSRIKSVKTQTDFRTRLAHGVAMIGQSLNPAEIQQGIKDALRLNFPEMETDVGWFDLEKDGTLDPFENWVRQQRRFLLISDTQRDERFRYLGSAQLIHPWRSLAIVPFHEGASGKRLGVLKVAAKEPGRLSQEDIRVLDLYALLGRLGFENAHLHEKVEDMAFHDPLTGVFSRRAFDERLTQECGQASRFRLILSLAMVDIDHFKSVNDNYGHQTGDRLLIWLAGMLKKFLREVDFLARYGGEEFVVLFPETAKEDAVAITENIRREIDCQGFSIDAAAKLPVTISVGVSSFPNETSTAQQFLRAADERLYVAKGGGRNRIVST